MGWVWTEDHDGRRGGDVAEFDGSMSDRYSTRKVVKSQCRTEEVEPGKFIRKCEKTEQIFKDCLGRPSEEMQSTKEYTEEDVTDLVTKKGSFSMDSSEQAFNFPGLRSDIEAIEHSLFGGIDRFFEAAEEMKNGFFNAFGRPPRFYDTDSSSSSSPARRAPFKGYPTREATSEGSKTDGHMDIADLAKDI